MRPRICKMHARASLQKIKVPCHITRARTHTHRNSASLFFASRMMSSAARSESDEPGRAAALGALWAAERVFSIAFVWGRKRRLFRFLLLLLILFLLPFPLACAKLRPLLSSMIASSCQAQVVT